MQKRWWVWGALVFVVASVALGCAGSPGGRGTKEVGMASWYGPGFHGRTTASGERFNRRAFTAAHRTLPMGTLVRVRRLDTGRHVDVRINDRGPYAQGRIIDLSQRAARALRMEREGVVRVEVTVLRRP
mgnify:CR=1 FL=1